MKLHSIFTPRFGLIVLVGTLIGCATIRPNQTLPIPHNPPTLFSHALLDSVLQEFVNLEGQVNFTALRKQPFNLNQYYAFIAKYSPDSHPSLFSTEEDKLAYWINAYNAAVMKAVITEYPISSVDDIKKPKLLFFLSNRSGFFVFRRLIFGGTAMNLNDLENMIRKRFKDPRIHFSLNCASRSCPRLPQQAFIPKILEDQLDRLTREFVNEERNVRVDTSKRTVYLSKIFQWFEDDFLEWPRDENTVGPECLLDYISAYLHPEKASLLMEIKEDYEIQYLDYDWSLNDQNTR